MVGWGALAPHSVLRQQGAPPPTDPHQALWSHLQRCHATTHAGYTCACHPDLCRLHCGESSTPHPHPPRTLVGGSPRPVRPKLRSAPRRGCLVLVGTERLFGVAVPLIPWSREQPAVTAFLASPEPRGKECLSHQNPPTASPEARASASIPLSARPAREGPGSHVPPPAPGVHPQVS